MHALPAIIALGLLCSGAVALVVRLFWPRPTHEPDAADDWAQRNDLRVPSLEHPPEAQDTALDAAVASQIIGID